MIELLEKYPLSDIIIFCVILALAIKSLVDFYDWAHDRILKAFNKTQKKMTEKEIMEENLKQVNQLIADLQESQKATNENLIAMSKDINTLIASDKDDIKAYITKEHHHYVYQKQWIDDFTLNCIENRYEHYRNEGGNSFICGLMNELRALPKRPPEKHDMGD